MSKNIFIFVVCGAKEHIDTLHFSLKYLQKYSKNEIWVLTDSTRNEIAIQHDKIIDVKTPDDYDNHQASIYLKTGIYQFVPTGNKYCYLDTDVIALNENVDLIFDEYVAPITFAPDHCTMEQFSAYAVNCTCLEEYEFFRNKLENELIKIDPLRLSKEANIFEPRKKIIQFYEQNNSLLAKGNIALRYLFSMRFFHLTDNLIYDKTTKTWIDKSTNTVFMSRFNLAKTSRKVGLKWNYKNNYPMLPDKRNLWKNNCYHLQTYISDKFNVTITNRNFQHWNGGVFLFDNQSHEFLKAWFDKTMEIFKDPKWKTRDQGTLIATVWEFGLQNHPMLNKKWNLIADYNNPFLKWVGDEIQLSDKELYIPVLVHVYHHFGDESWDFWNELIRKNTKF